MSALKEIGQRLKEWRNKRGLTQQELAQKLGVARQTIASWEVGRTDIPNWALKKLKEEFNLDLNWLIAGKSQ
jgi:DNA-binding XRE family transcriptional regulator